MVPRGAANAGGKPAVIPTTSSGIPEEGADACTAFAAPGGGGGRADEASGEVRREGATEAAGARRLSVVGPPCCFAGFVTPRRLLDVRGLGARGVQGEGAARGLANAGDALRGARATLAAAGALGVEPRAGVHAGEVYAVIKPSPWNFSTR